MNEIRYATNWVKVAIESDDPYDRFVYAFFALNALYNKYYKNSERQAIKSLFYDRFKNKQFRKKVDSIMDLEAYDYFVKRRPIRNCRYVEGVTEPRYYDTACDTYSLADYDAKTSNISMLMIIYQIRCNLFHGNKQYHNHDDMEIMENSSTLLIEYMKAFLGLE